MTLSDSTRSILRLTPFGEAHVTRLATSIVAACDRHGYSLAGNLMVGMDVNGPIVTCGDADLIPHPGAPQAVARLVGQPGVRAAFMTGWDLETMRYFRDQRLGVPVGIVCESGLTFEQQGQVIHLYPYDVQENLDFLCQLFDLAAEDELKLGFQGNASSGQGSVHVEADRNGNVLSHPLVAGRRPTPTQLLDAITPESGARLEGGRIVFENRPSNLHGLLHALLRLHPLLGLRVRRQAGEISLEIDPEDRPGFDLDRLREFADRVRARTGREVNVFEDFGIDCLSPKVKAGNYSKEAGIRAYGRQAFGSDEFLVALIGDKASDLPRGRDRVLMFALQGSEAEALAQPQADLVALYPHDIRDFALALAEARRIAGADDSKAA
jgi:hypothetical protein